MNIKNVLAETTKIKMAMGKQRHANICFYGSFPKEAHLVVPSHGAILLLPFLIPNFPQRDAGIIPN